MSNSQFEAIKRNQLITLAQYVPVVDRVHGDSHPEFHDVKAEFDKIQQKIQDSGSDKPDLEAELSRLRQITNHYSVPKDVCETYEAVYEMLAEVDEAYHA